MAAAVLLAALAALVLAPRSVQPWKSPKRFRSCVAAMRREQADAAAMAAAVRLAPLDALALAIRSAPNRATLLAAGTLPALAAIMDAAISRLNALAAVLGTTGKIADIRSVNRSALLAASCQHWEGILDAVISCWMRCRRARYGT